MKILISGKNYCENCARTVKSTGRHHSGEEVAKTKPPFWKGCLIGCLLVIAVIAGIGLLVYFTVDQEVLFEWAMSIKEKASEFLVKKLDDRIKADFSKDEIKEKKFDKLIPRLKQALKNVKNDFNKESEILNALKDILSDGKLSSKKVEDFSGKLNGYSSEKKDK